MTGILIPRNSCEQPIFRLLVSQFQFLFKFGQKGMTKGCATPLIWLHNTFGVVLSLSRSTSKPLPLFVKGVHIVWTGRFHFGPIFNNSSSEFMSNLTYRVSPKTRLLIIHKSILFISFNFTSLWNSSWIAIHQKHQCFKTGGLHVNH